MDTINNLVFIAILLIVVDTSYSLQCYDCSSTEPNRSCFDPIDVNVVKAKDCDSSTAQICMSVTAISTDGTNRIVASKYCSSNNSNNKCESVKEDMLVHLKMNVTDCKSCEIDNCNAKLPNWGNRNYPGEFVFVFGAMVLILPKIIL